MCIRDSFITDESLQKIKAVLSTKRRLQGLENVDYEQRRVFCLLFYTKLQLVRTYLVPDMFTDEDILHEMESMSMEHAHGILLMSMITINGQKKPHHISVFKFVRSY